jgi:exodeoxyribonuclease VII large subunit
VLATLGRAPSGHLHRQRTRLHQQLREVRAGSRRRLRSERELSARRLLVLQRKAEATLPDCLRRRPRELERLALALAAHDPERTLERGYALVQSEQGHPVASAAQARAAEKLRLRFADGTVPARVPSR